MPSLKASSLRYRILDGKSGALLIDNLPTAGGDNWEVIGVQPGAMPILGRFTIPLWPPRSPKGRMARDTYALLDTFQRVEGYAGPVGAGDPVVSGVITNRRRSLKVDQLEGVDSLFVAEAQQALPGEVFGGLGDLLVTSHLGRHRMVFGDDFSGSLAGYTQTPAANWTIATDEGVQSIAPTSGAGTDATILTTTAWAQANYTPICLVDALFRLVSGTHATDAGEASVVVEGVDANHYVFGRAHTHFDGTLYHVDAEIYRKTAAATYVLQKQVLDVLPAQASNTFRLQVTMVGSGVGGANYTWRLLINGVDSGCTYTYAAGATPSGSVGVRWAPLAGGAPAMVASQLFFMYRDNVSPAFQTGTITAGTKSLGQAFSGQTFLELFGMAATTESYYLRKRPKAGLYQDLLDFGPAVGTDLQNNVIFREGQNLEDIEEIGQAEPFASDLRLSATPGAAGSGSLLWHNVAAINRYGMVTDTSLAVGLSDFLGMRRYAQALAGIRGTPFQAKKLTVQRDPDTADRWGIFDYVTLHVPSLQIYMQKVLVLAYTRVGGSRTQEVIVDQFPPRTDLLAKKIKSPLLQLVNTYKAR